MADFEYGQQKEPTLRKYWWKQEENIHEDVFASVEFLKEQQTYRRNRILRNLRLYGNIPYAGLQVDDYFRIDQTTRESSRLTFNIVKTMVDTMANRISKNKPLPTFLTEGGAYDQQLKAKRLQKFIKGIFYEIDAYKRGQDAFKDAEQFGTGVSKIFRYDNKICLEKVFPAEIHVDEEESFYGNPRQMFQEKYLPKEVLMEAFPEFEEAIAKTDTRIGADASSRKMADNLNIIEAWHLPSGKGAKDGRHVIAIEGTTILDEEWNRDKFPFVFMHYSPPTIGFWGQGLTDELVGIQVEINKILRTIQRAMHLLSIPKVFIDASSKIVKSHFNNEIGGMITYSGVKPTVEAFSAVSPELFSHLDRLYQRAFEITGISQLQAQGLKPMGLDSGKAIRSFNDIQTERFILNGMAYEDYFMDLAEHCIELGKEISEDDPKFSVMAVGKRQTERIRFKEVDLDRDKYSMKMFPVSALSETPSARLQEVQELVQAGFVERDTAVALLDFPDLENTYSELTAQSEMLEMVIDNMLQSGTPRFIAPDPFMNLPFGIKRMKNAYLRGRLNQVPQNRLGLMAQWISQAEALLQQAEQAAIEAQSSPPPGALPEPAPRSDLLPVNTPANVQAQQAGII